MTPVDGLNRDDLVNEGQVIGHLDNSGCGTRALHVERKARDVSVNISFHCAYERSYYGEVMDDAPHDISGIK
jgi:hypothetical protein